MRNLACIGIVAALALSATGAPRAQTVYKSVGPGGKVVYSDRPPTEGRLEKTMKFENLPSSALPASASSYVEKLRKMHAADAATPAPAMSTSGVLLYSAAWCGYCRKAKAYLADRGVAYRDVDIDTRDGMDSFARAGGGGIPVVVVDGRSVRGFSTAAYDALFPARR